MKFCFIIPDLEGGGAQRVLLTFAQKLLSRGHDVTLIRFGERSDYSLPSELRSLVLRKGDLSGGWLNKLLLAWRLRRSLASLQKNGKFDFISSSLPFADEVVRLSGLPDVWLHVHNTLSQAIYGLSQRSASKGKRRTRRYRRIYSAQKIVAVSRGVADDLVKNFGADPARTKVVYNPFDLDEIERLSKESVADIPSGPYLLHAGRMNAQKRHDILLDAFKLSGLPHKLVLLNEPSEKLLGMIAERNLGEKVIVAGFQKNPYPWYRRATLFILSSDFEGFGNVLVEAMICGTPAVSTDCPSGPNEILSGELAQFLSPPGDAAALASNMRKAIASPPAILRENLVRFSADKSADDLEALARGSSAQ